MLNSKWGIRLVALILALFVFLNVNDVFEEMWGENTDSVTEVIEAVPVEVLYDSDNYAVLGIPQTINVELYGNQASINRIMATRDINVFLDLRNRGTGEYEEFFRIEGLPQNVSGEALPRTATVVINEIISKEFQVEVEYDESRVPSDKMVASITATPDTAIASGMAHDIESIEHLRANIHGSDEITDGQVVEANIEALDSNMNHMNVDIEPTSSTIQIDLADSEKEVEVNVETTGENSNVSINNILLESNYVTIYGDSEHLENVDYVTGHIDISEIEESTIETVELDVPDGVERVVPETVEAEIIVE